EPAPIGLDTGVARPPVGEMVRLGDEGPDVLPGNRQALRRHLPHRPRRDCTRCARSSMKRWRSDETATAATSAPSPPKTKRNIGPIPAPPRNRLQPPPARTRSSPPP